MTVAAPVERRAFDVKHAKFGAMFTDGIALLECVATRELATDPPGPQAALKLLDVSGEVPRDPFEQLDAARWYGLAEMRGLAVLR